MTTAKGQYRKRRATTSSNIPKNIQQWFSGERCFTFYAYSYPYRRHLKDYWQAWQAEHPDAVKPAGLDNLIENSRLRESFHRQNRRNCGFTNCLQTDQKNPDLLEPEKVIFEV